MNKQPLLPLALALMMVLSPALSACSDDNDELLESTATESTSDSDECCE